MNFNKFLFICIIIILSAGINCEKVTNPENLKDPSIVCVLKNDAQKHTLSAYYTSPDQINYLYDIYEHGSSESNLFIKDADVKIFSNNEEYKLNYYKNILDKGTRHKQIIQYYINKSKDKLCP